MRIGEPATDGNGVLRMEDVRRWRVIDDDGFLKVAPDLRQILDVISLMVVTTFSE